MRSNPLFPYSPEEKVGHLTGPHAERAHLLEGLPPHGPEWHSDPEIIAKVTQFDAPVEPVGLPDVARRDTAVTGPHGPVPVRVYTPRTLAEPDESGRRGAIMWIHGGAFIGGDLDGPEGDHTSARLADLTGLPVVSVGYRLCVNGIHHPVPHDDCWAAWTWMGQGGLDEFGLPTDPERMCVGGGSAGACLAGTIGLHGRDAGAAPAGVFLIYPLVHYPRPAASAELTAALSTLPSGAQGDASGDDVLMPNYLGDRLLDIDHPGYALPGMAKDLAGYPRTYVENCEMDDLRASGEEFVRQLEAAGVDVEAHTVPGEMHGHLSVPGLPSAIRTCEHAAAFCRDAVGASGR